MTNTKLDFLKKSIEARIEGINDRRLFYRRQSYYVYLSTASLAALTSILSGLKFPQISEIVRIITMIVASAITLINTYSAFYHHKEMWVANNEALNKFYELKFNVEFYENDISSITDEKVEQFKNSYQVILNELNQSWYKTKTAK